MPMASSYDLLQGGLDLVTPPMAVPAGRAVAAMNYEPEARGYRRIGGYERFDGRPSPSRGANAEDIATRRAVIGKPPGRGPIRGVQVFEGEVYCFRDSLSGDGQMFRSTPDGWEKLSFGFTLTFKNGSAEFSEGVKLLGATSAAVAVIDRVVLQSGVWDGSAAGYLVISSVVGAFGIEQASDSAGGMASVSFQNPITLTGGGHYDFAVHNFYGATRRRRLYFASGVDPAHEFDGNALCPIRTSNEGTSLDSVIQILTRAGATVMMRDGATLVARGRNDMPIHIGVHSNHLFLAFGAGALIHSGVGEPMDYRSAAGAGEISFGGTPTAILSSVSTSLVIFGQTRVEYIQGTDSDSFEMKPVSDNAGAARWSVQLSGEAPIYLDEGGLRKLNTTSSFGGWRMGTLSQLIEPLIRAKREAGVLVAASVNVKSKDQYWLFFNDGTGLILYLGRKNPELMPIRFPAAISCACAGELSEGARERIFVGSENGFVYELESGSSFDGATVPAYIRLTWNAERAANIEKRFHSARVETDNQSPMSVGFTYHVDYNATENLDGELHSYAVAAGSASFTPAGADYAGVDWQLAAAGEINIDDLSGLGRNIALTLITEHTAEEPHTFTALTLNYSARRQLR